MKDTKIRWAEHTWNTMTGCTKISPGCDNCYAETIALKFRGTAFPNGFDPTFKPNKLTEPRKWSPSRVFVNSMSDVFHDAFDKSQIDQVFDTMLDIDKHDYLLLTKRPGRMKSYLIGRDGWLSRRNLDEVPPWIWLGTSVESDEFVWRADHLRQIPVAVRFLSCEPLLGPLPSLDYNGLTWIIVGGESGKGYRVMEHDWARQVRDECAERQIAFYFKQSSAPRTEMGITLDDTLHEEYPFSHPTEHGGLRQLGRYTGRHGISASAMEGVA
jgi:protein gp37